MERLRIAILFGALALMVATVSPAGPAGGVAVAATPKPAAKPTPKHTATPKPKPKPTPTPTPAPKTKKPPKPKTTPTPKSSGAKSEQPSTGKSGSKPKESPTPKSGGAAGGSEAAKPPVIKLKSIEICIGQKIKESIESHGSMTSHDEKPEGIAGISSSGHEITISGESAGEADITFETEEMSLSTDASKSEMVKKSYHIHVKVKHCPFNEGDWAIPENDDFASPPPKGAGGAGAANPGGAGAVGQPANPAEPLSSLPCFQKALTAARNAAKGLSDGKTKAEYGTDAHGAANDARDAGNNINDDAGAAAAGAMSDGAKRSNGGPLSDVNTVHYKSGDVDVFGEEGWDGVNLRVTQVFVGKQPCKHVGDWKYFVLVVTSVYGGDKYGKKTARPKSVHAHFKILVCCEESDLTSNVPKVEKTESPSTPVEPKPEEGNGEEGSFYAPPNGDPNGVLVGTVDDPGPSGFYYEVVNQAGHKSFFKSVTDATRRFAILAPAGAVAIYFARHFDHRAQLDHAAQTDLRPNQPITNARPFAGAPAHGPAITDGSSAFARNQAATFGVRGIDPRNARVLVDGNPNEARTLAASSRSVVADVSRVSDGEHRFSVQSGNVRTESVPADVVDVHIAMTGAHQTGGTQQAECTVTGLPAGHSATLELTIAGGSVFANGSNRITVPVVNGKARATVRNEHPGQVILHYQLHVKIPGAWL